ncbi:MAG TPA: nicotinamide riboside transporter PnuC [Chitinophagaceae bacterium]|nr:nicotinamide riboside transporter PnuC [Chitinophagaceae bacterium]
MDHQIHLLLRELISTSWLEWLAVLFGVAEVLYARANKIWLYPTGIAGVLLSMYLFFQAGLYAECALNGYYLVMSLYGWVYWIRRKGQPEVPVSVCTRKEWGWVVGMTLAGFGLLVFLLDRFTASTVPVWDAWVSATAWAGMWLLARRKLENWILLNISNACAIPLLWYKQLPLYAVLTLYLFLVAVQGYRRWRQILTARHTVPARIGSGIQTT